MTTMELLNKTYGELTESIRKYNEALKAGDLKALQEADAATIEAEKSYKGLRKRLDWDNFKASANPMLEIIKKLNYTYILHEDVKNDNGVVIERRLNPKSKVAQHDLKAFCADAGISTAWWGDICDYNKRLALVVAKGLSLSNRRLKEIDQSYKMGWLVDQAEKAEADKDNPDPRSKTQMTRALQAVIDAIFFEDDGNGKNKWKAASHDAYYISQLYCKKGKAALAVSSAKDQLLMNLIHNVLHSIVTGECYDLEVGSRKVKAQDTETVSAPTFTISKTTLKALGVSSAEELLELVKNGKITVPETPQEAPIEDEEDEEDDEAVESPSEPAEAPVEAVVEAK